MYCTIIVTNTDVSLIMPSIRFKDLWDFLSGVRLRELKIKGKV